MNITYKSQYLDQQIGSPLIDMEKVIAVMFDKSAVVQKFCDIGAKVLVIAVGGMILGRQIYEAVAEKYMYEESSRPIGFRVNND